MVKSWDTATMGCSVIAHKYGVVIEGNLSPAAADLRYGDPAVMAIVLWVLQPIVGINVVCYYDVI